MVAETPLRVFGRVEPLNREVFVGTLQSKRVVNILAGEGQMVSEGQVLIELESELEQQAVELAQLKLVSPIDGLLYKLDIRRGELITPQDYRRIVVGEKHRQVRIFVETFWLGKLRSADSFIVKDAETLEVIGEGTISEISEFVGARDFRSEDSLERLDTSYAQAILHFFKELSDVPLGKLVLCERKL